MLPILNLEKYVSTNSFDLLKELMYGIVLYFVINKTYVQLTFL